MWCIVAAPTVPAAPSEVGGVAATPGDDVVEGPPGRGGGKVLGPGIGGVWWITATDPGQEDVSKVISVDLLID